MTSQKMAIDFNKICHRFATAEDFA